MNFLQAIATLLLKAMGWKIRKDVPEIPKKCVAIGAPHVSWVDMLIGVGGAVILKLKVKFLIKAEVFRFPWKGIFKALGGIPVDRYSSKAAGDRKKLVQEVVKKLETEKEFVLVLSPEGTRRKVTKWKRGFYRIAVAAKVPIALCYMDYVNKIGGVGKIVYPSSNMEADMKEIMAFYSEIPQKYPDRFSIDLDFSPDNA